LVDLAEPLVDLGRRFRCTRESRVDLPVELGQAAASFTLTPNVTEPGRVRIGLFDSRPLGGTGEIAVVSFQVVGRKGDESPLSLEAAVDEGRIAATVKNGKIRVRSGR